MSAWRREAIARLPELKDVADHAPTPGMLWIEVFEAFRQAHREPRNDDFIRRVYEFADWCARQADVEPNNISTTVSTHFYEDLPADPLVRASMPRFPGRKEILGLANGILRYWMSEEQIQQMLAEFDMLPKPPRWKKKR